MSTTSPTPQTWAEWTYGQGYKTFKDIPPGGVFCFRAGTDHMTKTGTAGWYRDTTGRRWRTGLRTAVLPVTTTQENPTP